MVVKYCNRFPRQVVGVFVLKNVKDLAEYGPQQPDLIKQGGSVAECFHDCIAIKSWKIIYIHT